MESEKRINWLSLFIKIVIVFIFILIIIWLISKLLGIGRLSKEFKDNINNMEKVSLEYFKTIELPIKKGKSIKITLEELIDKELIISTNKDSDNKCDAKNSYSEITREEKKYTVSTTLKCGREKDTIKESFSLSNCKNCNNQTNKEEEQKDTSDKENIDNSDKPKETIYYEHIKKTKEYTKWTRGNLTGNNIENKYEYYSIDYQTYYTLGVIPRNTSVVEYTLKLKKVPNKKYYFTTVEEVTDFQSKEEKYYLKENNVSTYKGYKGEIPNKNINNYSLRESNYIYKISPYYRDGSFYIKIVITIKNTNGIDTYYDKKIQDYAYLIPLKIKVKFASNETKDTKPTGKYETITYYRYINTKKETIWSTEEYIKGYTKTGKTKTK